MIKEDGHVSYIKKDSSIKNTVAISGEHQVYESEQKLGTSKSQAIRAKVSS